MDQISTMNNQINQTTSTVMIILNHEQMDQISILNN